MTLGNAPTRRRGDFAFKGKTSPVVETGSRDSVILEQMRAMIEEGKDLTMSGKPEAPALSARLGFEVDAKQRDRLMRRL